MRVYIFRLLITYIKTYNSFKFPFLDRFTLGYTVCDELFLLRLIGSSQCALTARIVAVRFLKKKLYLTFAVHYDHKSVPTVY